MKSSRRKFFGMAAAVAAITLSARQLFGKSVVKPAPRLVPTVQPRVKRVKQFPLARFDWRCGPKCLIATLEHTQFSVKARWCDVVITSADSHYRHYMHYKLPYGADAATDQLARCGTAIGMPSHMHVELQQFCNKINEAAAAELSRRRLRT